jgi:hypothetical protein
MKQSRIDNILASEEELIPSSGFLASVMESVHEEARTPQPIPFPWKRAVTGMVLATGVFGWAGFALVRPATPIFKTLWLMHPHLSVASAAVAQPIEQAGWIALALAASLGSWLLSRRLAGRSGLL